MTTTTTTVKTWAGSSRSRALAWALFTVCVVGLVGLLVLELGHHDPTAVENLLSSIPLIILPTGLGTLLALRQPANPIGWLLTSGALDWLLGGIVGDLAKYSLAGAGPASVAARLGINYDDKSWPLGVICSVGLPLLLFPAGHPRSRTGRGLGIGMVSGGLLALVSGALTTGPLTDPGHPSVRLANPLGLERVGLVTTVASRVGVLLVIATVVCSVVGIALRFRSVTGAERQQLRWVGYGAALAATGMLIFFFDGRLPHQVIIAVFTIGFGCLPLTFTVAILRYRLYDLDRIISRTVTYAAVSGLLVFMYAGLVTAVSRLTPSGSSLAVAASTLAVAALFQPLRRRIQRAVDRRFNRARVDADLTVEAFSRKLREQVDLEVVRADLLAAALQTMQPTSAALWLRSTGAAQ